MKRQIAFTFAMLAVTAGVATRTQADEGIVNGVHGYKDPKDYVQPKEKEVLERLEWFKDQKLGFFMHFGIYCEIGLMESWPLVDSEAEWSRVEVDWEPDGEKFKRQYIDLNRSFNPVRFQPDKWADVAARNGFKYVIFTTKHHDGFCLWDTKYSDYKVTAPECPFSTHPKADITRHVFDAFRKRGLGIAAYFSKPDWHHPDFWENCGLGYRTTRYPTYDVKKFPARWKRFVDYTANQMLELIENYGPIDILWLDGGQVARKRGLDINIEDIVARARKINPGLISVDRCCDNAENVITPEKVIPPYPMRVPWESNFRMGDHWGYAYDGKYMSARQIIQMLMDIVAKGGNLALDVGPMPDGRLPQPAIRELDLLGAWLRQNGEAVYATRSIEPFRVGRWAYTRKGSAIYATYLWADGEKAPGTLSLSLGSSRGVKGVTHLASGKAVAFAEKDGSLVLTLPADFKADAAADAFKLQF